MCAAAHLQTDAVSSTSYISYSEQLNISLSQHWRPILAPSARSQALKTSVDVHLCGCSGVNFVVQSAASAQHIHKAKLSSSLQLVGLCQSFLCIHSRCPTLHMLPCSMQASKNTLQQCLATDAPAELLQGLLHSSLCTPSRELSSHVGDANEGILEEAAPQVQAQVGPVPSCRQEARKEGARQGPAGEIRVSVITCGQECFHGLCGAVGRTCRSQSRQALPHTTAVCQQYAGIAVLLSRHSSPFASMRRVMRPTSSHFSATRIHM